MALGAAPPPTGMRDDDRRPLYDSGVMTSSGDLPASHPAPRGQRRHAAHHRRHERRRRQRRRLLPLTMGMLLVVALLLWLGGRSSTSSVSPATTSRPATTTTTAPPYLPPAIKPPIATFAGAGQWVAKDSWAPGGPSVMTTSWQPFAAQPNVVAYASWMRASSTMLALYPGYKGPGETTLDRGPEQVPSSGRSTLLATFNSGFYEADAAGGFYANGTLYFPMVNGLATVVQYANGTVDVIPWSGGSTPSAGVIMARQNLGMLVSGAEPTPATANASAWGITLGGVPAVWRTGLGVDAHGNLIYVAASSQTAASLAQVLIQAGAVRAMQLDINPEWPIFVTYGGSGAASPSLEVPNPNQVNWRFLVSSTKDFFALYQRVPGVVQQPW